MINFIKAYTLTTIRTKIVILYLLNVTDIIFTLLLINTGLFYEANPLLKPTISNESLTLLIKLVVPAVLLGAVYFRISDSSERQLRISNLIINSATLVYLFINCSHLFWLGYLKLLGIN